MVACTTCRSTEMKWIAAILLLASASASAQEVNPFDQFDGPDQANSRVSGKLGATDPLTDRRVRSCILKHIGEAKTDHAVVLVYRVCLAEYGYRR